MTGKKPAPTVIWRISDGRPGHDTQSLGLVRALIQLGPFICHEIDATTARPGLYHILIKKFPSTEDLPDPDLIIGAGHGTHLSILGAQRARGGKTIVIMKPSLPYSWFDCCLIPEHDNPPRKKNIIITRGAINTITPTDNHSPDQGLIMIGGPSRHYSWNAEDLTAQIDQILKHSQPMRWTITDSPRSPDGTLEDLSQHHWQNVDFLPYKKCPADRLQELYANAGTIWVTEDSISMLYEALTSGAIVGLLHVPRKNKTRVSIAVDNLLQEHLVTAFNTWSVTKKMEPSTNHIYEARRCAELLGQKNFY